MVIALKDSLMIFALQYFDFRNSQWRFTKLDIYIIIIRVITKMEKSIQTLPISSIYFI